MKPKDEALELLRHLYFWVAELPIKHPQQAQWRKRVEELLGIRDP